MSNCQLCRQGDPAFTVRCLNCKATFHVHKRQLDMAPEGSLVMGDCPSCGTTQCWQKRRGKVAYSGPAIYDGQPILDLRSGIPSNTGLEEQISTLLGGSDEKQKR